MKHAASVLVALVLTSLVACASQTQSWHEHAGNFEGEWSGHYTNSLGESGNEILSLHYSEQGELMGAWGGDTMVRGEQTGEHSIHLRGERNNGTTYEITAHRKHGEMQLHYYATRANGSTYEGWEELHRINP